MSAPTTHHPPLHAPSQGSPQAIPVATAASPPAAHASWLGLVAMTLIFAVALIGGIALHESRAGDASARCHFGCGAGANALFGSNLAGPAR